MNLTKSSKAETLFSLEQEIAKAARAHQFEMKSTRLVTSGDLRSVSSERSSAIELNLLSVRDAFLACTTQEIDPWNDREFFKLCMSALHVSFPKEAIDNFVSGDLVEGYDLNRMQIFRNLQFMEYSNYSLLEIVTMEWPRLFERSNAITDRMITYCDEKLWMRNRTINFDIPTHYMRELQTDERQMYQISFRHLSPLYSGPERPFGILGTCQCRPIASSGLGNISFV